MNRKSFGSVIANGFSRFVFGLVAVTIVGLVFFYIAVPKLKALMEGLGQ